LIPLINNEHDLARKLNQKDHHRYYSVAPPSSISSSVNECECYCHVAAPAAHQREDAMTMI